MSLQSLCVVRSSLEVAMVVSVCGKFKGCNGCFFVWVESSLEVAMIICVCVCKYLQGCNGCSCVESSNEVGMAGCM